MADSPSQRPPVSGVLAVFATPLFLGMAPIFGKLAINADADPFSVAAIRTVLAALILWAVYAVFYRKDMFIYPAGLMGCIVIGTVNGIGSLFYYSGLGQLDASLVQLINGMYLPFALLIAWLGGQRADRRTLFRVGLAIPALVMLTVPASDPFNWSGVGFMLGSALMFAGTVVLSQYVLYEMPARTVALYTLTTMAVVVTMVWMAVGNPMTVTVVENAMPPIVILGITTALSRLAMFAGVKFLGGMQTAIVAILEIAVALILSFIVLNESLLPVQWGGVMLLFASMLLIRQKDLLAHNFNPNALIVANMASVQFQRIAFHRAFGTTDTDNELGTMSSLTTQELVAIQNMMGARSGAIDPYPIRSFNAINDQIASAKFGNLNDIEEALATSEITMPPERDTISDQVKGQEMAIPEELFSPVDEDTDPASKGT